MKILGHRLLVSKVEEEKQEGFQAVAIQDNFIYMGKVEQIGDYGDFFNGTSIQKAPISEGSIVLFAKYSPDTQEIDHEGKKMKIINIDDVLAVV